MLIVVTTTSLDSILTKLYGDFIELLRGKQLACKKENEGDLCFVSDFPFLLLRGLLALSFGFFRHYSSLKLQLSRFSI